EKRSRAHRARAEQSKLLHFIFSPKENRTGTRHVPVDRARTAHLPLGCKRIVPSFIESSAGVAVLQHVPCYPRAGSPDPAEAVTRAGFRKPVAPSRQAPCPACRRSF